MADQKLDLLTLTATEIQHLLSTGLTTSISLVKAYLAQIATHNHAGLHLNALISIAPEALLLETASRLDSERASGHLRSPLHGTPIVLKDTFLTSTTTLGLPTTCGSPALATATSDSDSPLVQTLIDAGLIVLGKANMTELCGLKMRPLTPGWSSMGGQTQNPYIFGGLEENEVMLGNSSAGGSSSGSAVSVAAGFAPLALGTEVVGSVITPSNRAGLYALKCGVGTVEGSGDFGYWEGLDCVGAMGKGAMDVELLANVIMHRRLEVETDGEGGRGGFSGLRIGVLDPTIWNLPESVTVYPGETKQVMERSFWHAVEQMKIGGAEVTDNDLALPWDAFKFSAADFPMSDEHEEPVSELGGTKGVTGSSEHDGDGESSEQKSLFQEACMHHLRTTRMPAFLSSFKTSEIRSLEDMVAWNEAHKELAMPISHPSQQDLVDLLSNTTTPSQAEAMAREFRKRGKDALDPILKHVHVLVALGDSPLCTYAAAAGESAVIGPASPLDITR
ncbi:hypothetical protein LTR95_014123 [Oleoguttula sp. CCFEE 5521]